MPDNPTPETHTAPIVQVAFEKAVDYVARTQPVDGGISDPSERVDALTGAFIEILYSGEQRFGDVRAREREAELWGSDDDPRQKDRTIYSGHCLGTMRHRTPNGGAVTRVGVWVPAFDTGKECETVQDARSLWNDYSDDRKATGEDGVLYVNGIKVMRCGFATDGFLLDRPGTVIAAAKDLYGQPVKAYRELSEWTSDGKARQSGVCHRIVRDLDREDAAGEAGDGGTSMASEEPPEVSRASSRRSRSKPAEDTARTTGRTRKPKPAESEPAPEPVPAASAGDPSANGAPATRAELSAWVTKQGLKRPAISKYLVQCGFENGLGDASGPAQTKEIYETIVEGISEGLLGV